MTKKWDNTLLEGSRFKVTLGQNNILLKTKFALYTLGQIGFLNFWELFTQEVNNQK